MAGRVLECTGIHFRLPKIDINFQKFSTFLYVWWHFSVFQVLVVVVQESVFQRNTRDIDQDTWNANEKALRVPRAVNNGWRFTARMQVSLQYGPRFFSYFSPEKNDHNSKSVCSFDMGIFFLASLGQELSRDAFVVSVYAFGKKLPIRNDFWWHRKSRDFHENLTFLENG